MADTEPATGLIGVLDMGASAIRLVVAEIDAKRNVRVIEEASRGVLLGRDTFSGGVIRSQTVDAALEALDGFRHIMNGYGVGRHQGGGDERGPRSAQRRHVPRPHPGPHRHPVRNHQRGGGEPARLSGRPGCAAAARGVQGGARAADRGRRRQHQPHRCSAAGSPRGPASTRSARCGFASSSTSAATPRNCRSRCSTATSRTSSRKSASRFRSTASPT